MSKLNENRTRKLSFLGFNTRELSNTDDPDEVLLDNEMEKVFAGSSSLRKKNKFDVGTLAEESGPSMSNDEFEQQRNLSDFRDNVVDGNDKDNKHSSICLDDRNHDDLPEENSPLVSKRAEYFSGELSDTSIDEKRVQFTGPAPHSSGANLETDEDSNRYDGRKRRKSRHQYYRQRKYSHQEQDKETPTIRKTSEIIRKVSVQPEDFNLEEADINELTSHRSDDPRALRRPKIHHSSGRIQKLPLLVTKKNFDHSPHEIFVQLDELFGTGKDREWKETARWIKYEEHVEEGSDRWGRPHVASLSFHSLLNLRRCLETGLVLLDLEERDLPAIAYRVVEQMVIEEMIATDDKPIVMRALLLKHRHVNEHSHSHGFSFHKKKNSSVTSLQGLNVQHINLDDKKPKIIPASEINGNSKKLSHDMRIDMIDEHLSYSSSQEDLKKLQNDTILRRIPQGAEATTVLVGAVDFLEKPTIAFIRLAEGIQMPSITEVPIPVRFMFILMGPKIIDLDYHEVGRSIATLMSNEHFHDIAYKADDRKELLSAINEFLDDSIVLPPGNWDRPDLFPFEELKAKKDWIRSRKAKALNEKRKSQQLKKIAEDTTRILLGIDLPSCGGGDGNKNNNNRNINDGKDNHGYIPIGFDKLKKPPSPLEKTHRCWGGLLNDIKRRYSFYKSDIKDGLNTETLAASIFMYFASLSTAITFGGLMSEKTHNLIGISETLLSTSIVGLIFHTFAGQPLVIIGTTGPLLLFDEALYQFCGEQNFNFLTVRAYVGMWLVIIGLTVSAFEGSVYVRLLTRFTQEIFSALITLIYIFETFMKLVNVYKRHPLLSQYNVVRLDDYNNYQEDNVRVQRMLNISTYQNITSDMYNDTSAFNFDELAGSPNTNISKFLKEDNDHLINQPNTALFCTFLTLGTFTVAYYLKLFRNSHFLGRTARRALGDFGVPIAIAIFVTVAYLIPDVYTEKLSVPEGISPSTPERNWIVSYGPVEIWLPLLSGIPAILVYILIFMESHISELIVDKPERGLKKGSGLHLDIVILCVLNCICGTFGMPWHCAATVRSVTHVSAVTIMSRTHAPGESPRIIEVKEQRLSGLFISLMIGLSVLMTPLLRLIPMAVLFGVFLYMGVASMSGVQLFDRLVLYFMPTKHHPPTPYVKRLPAWKMHTFTGIQIFCLTVLWTVKSSIISLAFPFFLILMVPLRIQLAKFYTPKEMNALDGNPSKIEADDEPDFYEQASIPA